MKDTLLKDILTSKQTVFSQKELLLMWGKADTDQLKSRINYYSKQGYLYPLRQGLYAKSKDYNRLEVATRILIPSYISFETVLLQAGVIFQYYEQLFVASYRTRTIVCDGHTYTYRTLREELLTDLRGILVKPYYTIASPERAFLDMVYLRKNYYYDNLSALNWDTIHELVPIYKNKRMEKNVATYYERVRQREDHDNK